MKKCMCIWTSFNRYIYIYIDLYIYSKMCPADKISVGPTTF